MWGRVVGRAACLQCAAGLVLPHARPDRPLEPLLKMPSYPSTHPSCTTFAAPVQNAMPVPDKLWLSAEKLDPEGVFLLENGFEAFIYVGKAVPAETCAALFGEWVLWWVEQLAWMLWVGG